MNVNEAGDRYGVLHSLLHCSTVGRLEDEVERVEDGMAVECKARFGSGQACCDVLWSDARLDEVEVESVGRHVDGLS